MTWTDVAKHDLTLYTTSWCSDCVKFKKLLARLNITYKEIDVDENQDAREYMVSKAGEFSIPQLELDGRIMVRGWHSELPEKWSEELFFKELGAALKRN